MKKVLLLLLTALLAGPLVISQNAYNLTLTTGQLISLDTSGVDFFHLALYHEGKTFNHQPRLEVLGPDGAQIIELSIFHEGPTPGRVVFEAGFFSGQTHAVRLLAPERQSLHMRVFVVLKDYPMPTPTTLSSEQNCGCSQPAFCDRSCWCPGGNCDPVAPAVSIQPTHMIVHHSAGSNTSSNFAAVVAAIRDFHVNTNGWDDIGYNWLIDPNGLLYEGRGSGKRGAHFSCMNGGTMGICMMGNYMTVSPSSAAVEMLEAFLAWEGCDKQIQPGDISWHAASQQHMPHIAGHRDGNQAPAPGSCARNTSCPGDVLYPMLPDIALRVAANPCRFGGQAEKVVISAGGVLIPEVAAGGLLPYFGQQTYLGAQSGPRSITAGVYLSADTLLDANDTLLATFSGTLDSLQPSHFFDSTWVVPAHSQQGRHYLLFVPDLLETLQPVDSAIIKVAPFDVSGTIGLMQRSKPSIQVFPNPAKDRIRLVNASDLQEIALFARNGHELAHWHPQGSGSQLELDVQQFPTGQYFLRLTLKNGSHLFETIIIQR